MFLRIIFTIMLLLNIGTVFAHQDLWLTKDFGNVKVRIETGYFYEEISKVFIIGQLAEKFAKQINYNDKIFLDFNHYYTGNCNPDYFISYDKGKIQESWNDKEKDYLKKKSIVVRQVSRKFDAETTLKLIEYAIENISQIKSSQKSIFYNKNYCQWNINSIDTAQIKKALLNPLSEQLRGVLTLKIEKIDNNFQYGLSYFFKDNKYTIFSREYNKEDTTLLVLDNIYGFEKIGNYNAIVFDTDSSFYYVSQNKNMVSERQVIENKYNNYRPYDVQSIGVNKISIYFWYYLKEEDIQRKHRILIYLTEEDELIQDLDKLIENK